MGFPANLLTTVLGFALTSSLLSAQASPHAPAAPKIDDAESSYPEQGYLSPSNYLNRYFGFDFGLPPDVHLAPVPQPASRDGSIQLLELVGPPPSDPEISIDAIPIGTGKDQDAKALLRFELDQELFRGVEELRGLSKATFGGHQFYLFETRRGIEQHVLLATTLDGYIVRVVLEARDEKILKKLETSFRQVNFFSPDELRQHLSKAAQPYDGPSVSSHRLEALEGDPPAAHIDPGKVSGDFYENVSLGFSYRIPQGWILEAEGAVQPAVERARAREAFGRPRMSRTEHRLLDACSRTLFSAWAKRPGSDGQIPYDEFGEVTVSAISLGCFSGMKFPETSKDSQQFKDFLLQFGLTQPILADMRDAKSFSAGNNIFLFLHGTVAFSVPNDELSRRLSIAMAITQQRGYLLTWFFAAPHDSELQALTDERVMFDSTPASKMANASQPGGGESSASAPALTNEPVPGTATPPGTTPNAATGASNDTAAATSATTGEKPTAQGGASSAPSASSTRDEPADSVASPPAGKPTLLRPGESMQTQQNKGAPISKQKQSD